MPIKSPTDNHPTREDLTGKTFERLTVLKVIKYGKWKRIPFCSNTQYECKCSCGNITTGIAWNIVMGLKRSCGCIQKEGVSKMSFRHGLSAWNGKKHPLYWVWQGMIQRCTNPNHHGWPYYGAKGITVCERWREFLKFLEDMEGGYVKGLTIDRKDSSLGYNPENVRWATWAQQNEKGHKTPRRKRVAA